MPVRFQCEAGAGVLWLRPEESESPGRPGLGMKARSEEAQRVSDAGLNINSKSDSLDLLRTGT